jgi:hypothetical protein
MLASWHFLSICSNELTNHTDFRAHNHADAFLTLLINISKISEKNYRDLWTKQLKKHQLNISVGQQCPYQFLALLSNYHSLPSDHAQAALLHQPASFLLPLQPVH